MVFVNQTPITLDSDIDKIVWCINAFEAIHPLQRCTDGVFCGKGCYGVIMKAYKKLFNWNGGQLHSVLKDNLLRLFLSGSSVSSHRPYCKMIRELCTAFPGLDIGSDFDEQVSKAQSLMNGRCTDTRYVSIYQFI